MALPLRLLKVLTGVSKCAFLAFSKAGIPAEVGTFSKTLPESLLDL